MVSKAKKRKTDRKRRAGCGGAEEVGMGGREGEVGKSSK